MQIISTLSLIAVLGATAMASAMPSASRAELQRRRCGEECVKIDTLLPCSDDWKKNLNICEVTACRVGMPSPSGMCLPCNDPGNPCVQLKDGSCGRNAMGIMPWIPGNPAADFCKQTGCLKKDDEIWTSCPPSDKVKAPGNN